MYVQEEELKSVIYAYQIDQITETDDDIVLMAITAAEDQVKSYLRPNLTQKASYDGRPLYDVDTIFNTTGTDRNQMLMEMIKNIAFYNLIRLCNADILYEKAKEMYDRAINWLRDVNKGNITLNLATLTLDTSDPDNQGNFSYGSRLKFNHE